MATTILLSSFVLLFPAITLYSEKRYKIIQWIGAVVICYITGIIIGNIPSITLPKATLTSISEISVTLAIPALLFSSDFVQSWKFTRTAIFSFVCCIIAVLISASAASFFLGGQIQDSWKLSGMLIGVYTGGTPNLNAIGIALNSSQELIILVNSADVLLSGIYFVFLISIGKWVLSFFLPEKHSNTLMEEEMEDKSFSKLPLKTKFKNVAASIGLSLIILGIAAGTSVLLLGKMTAPFIILAITVLGITGSFYPKLQKMEGTYQTAHYLLLIFALAIGCLADFGELISKSANVFLYVSSVISASILIHYLLAYVFKLDRDTVMITSTAAIFGPAFIGPVANRLQNKRIIIAGITTGMLGYGIGNFLGIGIAYLLQ